MARPLARRVLLVDDNASARTLLGDLLEPLGFEAEQAEHGARALHALAAGGFDVVFVDVMMPVLDGPSLLRVMRARGDETPVVVVSGADDTRLIASALKFGAADFLSKPYDAAQVQRVLATALGPDAGTLAPDAPRALLIGAGPADLEALRAGLPAHAGLDAATVAEAFAAAEARPYRLFLVDLAQDPAAATQELSRLRARQPEAACLALVEAGGAWRFRPGFPFDGAVERPLTPQVVRGQLYGAALRPLVSSQSATLTLLPFRGEPGLERRWLEVAGRRLQAGLEAMADRASRVAVDLSSAPARTAALEGLVATLAQVAEARGARLLLIVPPAVRPALERLGLRVELASGA